MMSIEVLELPAATPGRVVVVVRVDGEVVGTFGSLEEARKHYRNSDNRRALRGAALPSSNKTKLKQRFGKANTYAVLAVLDDEGNELYYIVTGPSGYIVPGSFKLDAALERAAALATAYDRGAGPPPPPAAPSQK